MSDTRVRLGAAALALPVLLAACSHPTAPGSSSKPGVSSPSSASGSAGGSGTPSKSATYIAAPASPVASGSDSASATQAATGDIEGCSWGTEDQPTQFQVPARNITEPMLTVGLDSKGGVGAPPHDQKFSVAIWNGGPQVGSDAGHVILTAHMWYGDVALGNVLSDPTNGLHAGDVIRISDGNKTVCYRYTHMEALDVATYDRNSTVWINPDGAPQLTIMICWNYNTRTGEWDSRHIFFADPIKP